MKYVVFYMCRTIKILISNWPRKLKFSQFSQAGKTCQLLLTFLTKVTRWSRSTSNIYALIGQDLTGEFMRKIYAASWELFTLTEFLCKHVIFLTAFFHWMYKMKYSCCYSWVVCLLVFRLKDPSLVKVGNPILDGIVFIFHLAWCVKRIQNSQTILALLGSFQEVHLEW